MLIELFPTWLVYFAFSLGILTMMGAVVLSGLAILFVIGGFGSAIGWWTWFEFKSWIVDAWQTLGQLLGFGGGQ